MSVLVDTSIWIDYFRNADKSDKLDILIDDNLAVTNQIILTEILPLLYMQNQKQLIGLMRELKQYSISIDWDDLVKMRITCLKHGTNGVGIPDLIIAQNAIQNNLRLFTHDKHFFLMSNYLPLILY